MNLDDVLAPLDRGEFITRYLGREYLFAKRGAGCFAGLVTWQELNETLRHLRVHGKRLRVVQNGRTLERHAYLADDGPDAYVDARRLVQLLSGGATLVIDQVDELFPQVQELAESCEEMFRIRVGVNLYAGWRTDNGFDLHWDRHDTLILQVAGRKHWTIYAPTWLHPVDDDPSGKPPTPTEPPVWEGVLEDGDVIYMPRGWWHVARPLSEPTLHLTVGWMHVTGLDLLESMMRTLRKREHVRADLPHLLSPEQQEQYLEQLRQEVQSTLTGDVIEKAMRASEDAVPSRPRLCLPGEITDAGRAVVGLDVPLRLTASRRLQFERQDGNGKLRVKIGDAHMACPAALAPALQLLRRDRACTLRMMLDLASRTDRAALQAMVFGMVAKGAIWAETN
jgi:ribosomal protein L16 Arg81 hydroxylase